MQTTFRLYLLLIFACFFSQCSAPVLDDHFLPSPDNLKRGIVHKYYLTDAPKDKNDQPRSVVQYRYYKQDKAGVITEQRFSPSMRLTLERQYTLNGTSVKLQANKWINYQDTTHYEIGENNTFINFEGEPMRYESSIEYESGFKRQYEQTIEGVRDTMIEGKLAKVVRSSGSSYTENVEGKKDTSQTVNQEIYVQNMGLWYAQNETEDFFYEMSLVEQIRPKAFQEMQAHGVKRRAYIDPTQALDKDEAFELCKLEHEIYDYYNETPHAGYIGGKKPLWAYIVQRLNPNMLHNESGYLTFRFVINCKGKAGRFITDQADLDFQKKEFHPETIEHCYNILKSIPEWQTIVLRDEPWDVYAYVTFKLENGKLIELLP